MLERVEPDESLGRLRELAAEQAALRRVATLVAEKTAPSEVFAHVCAEIGGVLGIESTNLNRFEDDGTQTVLGGWSVHGAPVFPVGAGVPVDGNAAVAKVRRSGRHAGGTGATVTVIRKGDWAGVEVSDNGVGGAELTRGSGLRGLADRIEALGGRLEIQSAHGAGTRLLAEIPLSGPQSD